MTSQNMRLQHLKTTIERREYRVDADKVAAAIVTRLLERSAGPGAQNSCS